MPLNEREQAIEELADQIRELWISEHQNYVRHKTHHICTYNPGPRWDGGRTADGKRHESIWLKIAQRVYDHGLDWKVLVLAMFEYHKLSTPPPPNLVFAKQGSQRYFSYQNKNAGDMLLDLRVQVDEFERAYYQARLFFDQTKDAVEYVLNNKTLGLSALFRYCVAYREGLLTIADDWKADALRMYFGRKNDYDEAWTGCIPEALLESSHGSGN